MAQALAKKIRVIRLEKVGLQRLACIELAILVTFIGVPQSRQIAVEARPHTTVRFAVSSFLTLSSTRECMADIGGKYCSSVSPMRRTTSSLEVVDDTSERDGAVGWWKEIEARREQV